jgi:hypothetical protein
VVRELGRFGAGTHPWYQHRIVQVGPSWGNFYKGGGHGEFVSGGGGRNIGGGGRNMGVGAEIWPNPNPEPQWEGGPSDRDTEIGMW